MKVIFVCGSMEAGRDGVGDYTRRLAIEMIRRGCEVAVVAINDRHIAAERAENQEEEGVSLPVFRLPTAWPVRRRFARAREWIRPLAPDWVSLQYVVYSFSRRGWPFVFGEDFASLAPGARRHLMFHELWIGMETGAPWRHRLLGAIQRIGIKRLIGRFKPAVVHTQTRLYVEHIGRLGYLATRLPLFGNIPRIRPPAEVSSGNSRAENELRLVHFGSIHPGAPIDRFAQELRAYARSVGAMASLTLLGRSGAEGAKWAAAFHQAGLPVHNLGEQSTEAVSAVLRSSTVGITSTPIALVEKSSSMLAMIEHGLPVICLCRDWQPRGVDPAVWVPRGTPRYQVGSLATILQEIRQPQSVSSVATVTEQLIQALQQAT